MATIVATKMFTQKQNIPSLNEPQIMKKSDMT